MSSTREPELDRDAPDIAALKQRPRVTRAADDDPTLTCDPLNRVLLHDETAFRTADSRGNAASGDRAVYPSGSARRRRNPAITGRSLPPTRSFLSPRASSTITPPGGVEFASERRRVCEIYERGRAVGPDGLPPHTITNAADTPSRHFIIELLGPSASDAPTEHQPNGRGRTQVLT